MKSAKSQNEINGKTAQARLNYLKMAPRKIRLVASAIKKLPVNEAEAQLVLNSKRASNPILQLLRSAIANAKNKKLNFDLLFVKEIRVDGGPMLKRWLPRAQGRATPIQKKSSHITLILAESEKTKAPRFQIEEKIKENKEKSAKKKKEKEKKYEKRASDHDHEHHEHEHKEKEVEKDKKGSKDPGLVKKIFRRKAI